MNIHRLFYGMLFFSATAALADDVHLPHVEKFGVKQVAQGIACAAISATGSAIGGAVGAIGSVVLYGMVNNGAAPHGLLVIGTLFAGSFVGSGIALKINRYLFARYRYHRSTAVGGGISGMVALIAFLKNG